ncbi:fructose-bisphosphate aldolase class I [Patescibacteria group bacterium]|nr:fructose-bisphosphate aldolase class I [Patescibacteria group bacterium]
MDLQTLKTTASSMVANGKGILAIDESHGTCKKRFDALGVDCTEETRRAYRGLLVSAPGISEFVSGMILFDETIRQKDNYGKTYSEVLSAAGMIPGIKVDTGAHDLALHRHEKVTEGLDGLRDRLEEYALLGARFAKWRAVITIGENIPSEACYKANAHALARYAALCQEQSIVPMVEPEILMDGNHSIERCYEVTAKTLQVLFAELKEQGVAPEGTILKVSKVLPGKDHEAERDPKKVAELTVKCLTENVPHELAGIVFLSGGQTPQDASLHLSLMNQIGPHPWPLSFSYGRAIQEPALRAWAEDQSDWGRAQRALVSRAKMNSLASKGEYTLEMEQNV